MALPPLPYENELDWFKKRDAYDKAVGAYAEGAYNQSAEFEGRVSALELIGGLEPGGITDGAMTDVILQPDSLFVGELNAAIGASVSASGNAGPITSPVDLGYAGMAFPTTPQTTETYDGSGQITHSSVVFRPQGWGGHRYWLAATPYPAADASLENPSIWYSEDGDNWTPIEGNPIDPWPGVVGTYNSDTHLVFGPDDTLYCFWRANLGNKVGDAQGEQILYRTSRDGLAWSEPVLSMKNNVMTRRPYSPAIRYRNGVWHMWTSEGLQDPQVIGYQTASAPNGPWSPVVYCTITPALPAGREVWHLDVQEYGGKWYCLLNDNNLNTSGGAGDLYLMESIDGKSWRRGNGPSVRRSGTTTAGSVISWYRSSMVPAFRDGAQGFDAWLCSIGTQRRLYRTFIQLEPSPTEKAEMALGGTLAPEVPVSSGMVPIGDSITIGASTTGVVHSNAWPTYAAAISNQALRLVRNAGQSGNRVDQMMLRFAADVAPFAPKIVPILAGSNDLMQGLPQAGIRDDYRKLVALVQGIGAQPIICTVPPRTGGESLVHDHNQWLRGYAAANAFPLVDFFATLAEGQAWKAGYDSGDGIHPTSAGYRAMGATFDAVVTPKLASPFIPNLATTQGDTGNGVVNGIFIAGGDPAVAVSWSKLGPTGNAVWSLEPTTAGNWQAVQVTADGVGCGLQQVSAPGAAWQPGDKVRLMAKVVVPQGGQFNLSASVTGGAGGTFQAARDLSQAFTGTVMIEFTVPVGATSITLTWAGAKIGVYKVSQFTVRKI